MSSATKKAPRKRKEVGDISRELSEAYKKNFDCGDINMKKMFHMTDNHSKFYYLSQNDHTNVIFLDGAAGTAKSYLAVYSALEDLKNRRADKIIYIRSVVESASRSMGYLKGTEEEKFAAYLAPLTEKALEIIDKPTLSCLQTNSYLEGIPVNFVRGRTFHNSIVIVDESQNMTRSELTTILTRLGRGSKIYVLGDAKQQDIRDSGFQKVYELFDTEFSRKNNIHCMKFDQTDIVRSGILKHITQVLSV